MKGFCTGIEPGILEALQQYLRGIADMLIN